jgi:hypothetical protein
MERVQLAVRAAGASAAVVLFGAAVAIAGEPLTPPVIMWFGAMAAVALGALAIDEAIERRQ